MEAYANVTARVCRDHALAIVFLAIGLRAGDLAALAFLAGALRLIPLTQACLDVVC
jgi:hypothetical protein